jgi:hypothetical protein
MAVCVLPRKNSNPHLANKFLFRPVIDDLVYIAQGDYKIPEYGSYQIFRPQKSLKYYPICDDFGPMNLASTTRFIELLEDEIYDYPDCKIVFHVDSGRRALSNAVYLLGSFMVLRLNSTAKETSKRFSWLEPSMIEHFRDATFSKPDFSLTLLDCWKAIERGRSLGWISFPSSDTPELWGRINIDRCGWRWAYGQDGETRDIHFVQNAEGSEQFQARSLEI